MGNSFGKIDDVSSSPPEQLSSEIYLDFAGFDQKCFIGRVMNVRRRNFARGSEKPRHAKGITRLLGTYQNVGFLPNGPYDTAVVDSQGFGFNILIHRLARADAAWRKKFRLAQSEEGGPISHRF
jgi:hypothetical protein